MAEIGLKKVLFVITKGNFGGAQKYVFDLATSLPKDQFEVVVAMGEGGKLKEKLDTVGIRTIQIGDLKRDINVKNELASFWQLFQIIRKEKPDILHLNSPKAGGLGGVAGRFCRVPNIIFTAHGFAFNESRPIWQKVLIKFFSWLTIVFAHKTICVSGAIKKSFENWPFVKNKMVIVHNGTEKNEYKAKAEARKFLFPDAPKDTVWIGTISELHHIKGLSYAIRAVRSVLHQHKVIFVVMGEGEERKKLEELIKNEGLENHVKLVGFVENAPKYLKAFDIFTLTSLSEALPLALLEAGSAELPVVGTNVGGIPEIITDGKSGIVVQPKDIINLTKALNFLIDNKKERALLAKNLKEQVVNNFSKEQMVKKTMAVYEAKT